MGGVIVRLVSRSCRKSTKPPGTEHEGFGERRYVALAYKRRSRPVVQFTGPMKPDTAAVCNSRPAVERRGAGVAVRSRAEYNKAHGSCCLGLAYVECEEGGGFTRAVCCRYVQCVE